MMRASLSSSLRAIFDAQRPRALGPGTIEAATAAESVNGEARHQLCLGLKPSWEFQQLTIVDRSSFAMNAVVPRDASKTAQRLDIIADGEPLA